LGRVTAKQGEKKKARGAVERAPIKEKRKCAQATAVKKKDERAKSLERRIKAFPKETYSSYLGLGAEE